MAVPNLVAIAANAGIFLWLFRDRLPRRLPVIKPGATIATSSAFFRLSLAVFAVMLAGLFLAGLAERPLWPVALVGGAALAYVAHAVGRKDLRAIAAGVSWPLFPFVVGMAGVVRGIEHAGLTAGLAPLIPWHAGTTGGAGVTTRRGAALAANLFNKNPMARGLVAVVGRAPPS